MRFSSAVSVILFPLLLTSCGPAPHRLSIPAKVVKETLVEIGNSIDKTKLSDLSFNKDKDKSWWSATVYELTDSNFAVGQICSVLHIEKLVDSYTYARVFNKKKLDQGFSPEDSVDRIEYCYNGERLTPY